MNKKMPKPFLQLFLLFVCCQSLQAQNKLEFNQSPTVWIADTSNIVDTTDLHFETISENDFLGFVFDYANNENAALIIQSDSLYRADSSEIFTIRTKHSYYEFPTTHTYSTSYDYIGFIPEISCHLIGFCGSGMCEMYLLDYEIDEKTTLPCSFDAGINAFIFSPNNQFLLLSSTYDGPDYENYYDYRAEIILYKIEKEQGLKGLKPYRIFEIKDYSIEDVVWINEDSIALKIYEEGRMGSGIKGEYQYLKTNIKVE